MHNEKEEFRVGLKSGVAHCGKCRVAAHSAVQIESTQQIYQVEAFVSLLCFKMMHAELGQQVCRLLGGSEKCTTVMDTSDNTCSFHGLPTIGSHKNTGSTATESNNNNNCDDSKEEIDNEDV